jgi:hypothetical protein
MQAALHAFKTQDFCKCFQKITQPQDSLYHIQRDLLGTGQHGKKTII